MTIRRAFVALLLISAPLAAQDSTRGVRIGLTYDPGSRPTVVVLASRGPAADTIRAIIQRDLDYGDRVSIIPLEGSAVSAVSGASAPVWAVLAKLGAAAAVQVTPTATGLHMAVYNVATQQTALVRDYTAPPMADVRGWRAALHGICDDLEESMTGTRGISRTRILFERGKRLWVVDSDGEQETAVTEPQELLSGAWSPDGTMITYSTVVPAQIMVLDLATGKSRRLVGGSGVFISPVFTPDGTNVVYAHGVDDGVDLYTVAVAGGAGRQISVGKGSDNLQPTFSPDGRRIAFMSGLSRAS